MVIGEKLLPTAFVTEWSYMGYCKKAKFLFWLLFIVGSPPSLATMKFPHSSFMHASLGESSKFPKSSISIIP